MTAPAHVAVVGSGVVGCAVAGRLLDAGLRVTMLERGPDFPYPHSSEARRYTADFHDPRYELPRDLREVTQSGDYAPLLRTELISRSGGMATRWRGIALRQRPVDFRTGTTFGHGSDWPIGYDDLETWYGAAERHLGVAGTDEDNPWAPPRSSPYPLPPFALTEDDRRLATRLTQAGIHLHTTPQAITSEAYDGRPGCENIGATCNTCPTGARWSPGHDLLRLRARAGFDLRCDTTVRRIVVDPAGRVQSLLCQGNDDAEPHELPATAVVLAAGAIESARLLLLSDDERNPDGLGNHAGQVGRNLAFHHMWSYRLRYAERLYPGRLAPMTGQSHQFLDPPERGRHGGVKAEFTSHLPAHRGRGRWVDAGDVLAEMDELVRTRNLGLHAETVTDDNKHLTLSGQRDRFGDPVAHVHYQLNDFDARTHAFTEQIAQRFADATGAEHVVRPALKAYHSVWHHMGTARMSQDPADGVTDPWGAVHGHPDVFVLGGANFVEPSPINPTLTMLALALRAADHMAHRLGGPTP